MELIADQKLKLVVKSSKCGHYKPGDTIYLDGAFVSPKTKVPVCLSALNAIYPFIYGARKRLTGEQLGFPDMTFQCPDVAESVEFQIIPDDEGI